MPQKLNGLKTVKWSKNVIRSRKPSLFGVFLASCHRDLSLTQYCIAENIHQPALVVCVATAQPCGLGGSCGHPTRWSPIQGLSVEKVRNVLVGRRQCPGMQWEWEFTRRAIPRRWQSCESHLSTWETLENIPLGAAERCLRTVQASGTWSWLKPAPRHNVFHLH